MAFEVLITDEAFADLDLLAGFIKREANLDAARKWFAGMIAAIESLAELPARCRRTPEAAELGDEVRVFHVRHWARKPLSEGDL